MSPKNYYLFANWKMYLNLKESVALAKQLAKKKFSSQIKMVVLPSALAFDEVQNIFKKTKISVGAQNACAVEKGGYTGEVSLKMFEASGAKFVLLGHSERRHVFHESNHDVRVKLEAALNTKLTPVLCVGETAAERRAGKTEEVLESQLRSAFMDLTWPSKHGLFIAYEPVWAIGTDEPCGDKEANHAAGLIKKFTSALLGKDADPIILYGGSVRPNNVAEFLDENFIKGVLVGGASTKLTSWTEIISAIK